MGVPGRQAASGNEAAPLTSPKSSSKPPNWLASTRPRSKSPLPPIHSNNNNISYTTAKQSPIPSRSSSSAARKSRRDANESVEVAIAKQLQHRNFSLSRPATSAASHSNHQGGYPYKPSFDAPNAGTSPVISGRVPSSLRSSRTRSHSHSSVSRSSGTGSAKPSVLVTHITGGNAFDVDEGGVGSLRRQSSISSNGLSVHNSRASSSTSPRSHWPAIMEHIQQKKSFSKGGDHVLGKMAAGATSPTASTASPASKQHPLPKELKRSSSGLSYGPITSSIDDQMAGRRANHRRSKQTTGTSSLGANKHKGGNTSTGENPILEDKQIAATILATASATSGAAGMSTAASITATRSPSSLRRPTTQHASRALPSVDYNFSEAAAEPQSEHFTVDSLPPLQPGPVGVSVGGGRGLRDWLPQSSFGTQNGIEASSPKKMDKRREPKQGGLHRGREARGGQGNEASLLLDIDDDVAGHMTDLRLDTPSLMTPRKIGGRPIDLETASALKTLLLGSATKPFPNGWLGQSLNFCSKPGLAFGLVQNRGGPCGALAAIQAFVLRYLIFPGGTGSSTSTTVTVDFGKAMNPSVKQRENALVIALAHILEQASNKGQIILAFPGSKGHFRGLVGQYKTDGMTETLNVVNFDSPAAAKDFLSSHLAFFTSGSNSSLLAFLYSVMLTRGLENVRGDMDTPDLPLMGAHGYCSQEMVHLLIIGKAISNTFDGNKILDEATVLKGIHSRSDIGLLSLFEHYGSIVVGDNLKTPAFPVWLVCSESHFTVLFGLSLGLERTSLADRRPVDLYYYDQLSRLTDKPVKFTIDCTNARNRKFMGGGGSKHVLASTGSEDEYLVSPIEHCLRTKWRDAHVGWNGSEPIL